jgi:predicted acetyltransferase
MEDLKLVFPSKEYKEKAIEYIQEFLKHNSQINGTGGLQRYENYDEWLAKVQRESHAVNIPGGKVPASTYFLVRTSDDRIVGMANIRHKLNEILLKEGGHVGYSIRPTERRKGYATLLLKMALEKCRELKQEKVLITCDKINIGSAKVIQNNNGILENEIYSETYSEVIQRYWISL